MTISLTIPGYDLTEVIYEGLNTIIYRAWAQKLQQLVILKVLKAEYPSLEQMLRLKHEYSITQDLRLEGVVQVYELETHQNRLILVAEDFAGVSLQQFLDSAKLPLENFLNIAIQLTKSLGALHTHQIIHKDIKPSNIIINPQTGVCKLTDFSIASCLSQETPLQCSPNQLEGTLTYISPEQTGRMNRSVDYRSDFYSLGVSFYQMLTGQLPFITHDPLELVYCHIAKQATPIEELNPAVPTAISQIVMKLMEKNAEERYQSSVGLLADLETCLHQFKNTGRITNFIPGHFDVLSQLVIPQKLYGREKQVNLLLEVFERVASTQKNSGSQSTKELILVSGYSGIGKSAIINEVNKPITSLRGYFISGKFEQFKRNIPYAPLTQAFASLMMQLLTESPEQLELWRKKLLTALGLNGQVVIDVISEVELIIGKQPKVPDLGPTESQNRFNQVFKEFIRVFTQKEHPLVIFLDDLQWADSATLKLMQLLMTDPDTKYLLLIGAYRDNEVNSTHPLIQTIEEISNTGTVINNIVVEPLDLTHVTQILCDTLKERKDNPQVQELASLLFNKTAGNPFFLTQILKALYREQLLTFDFALGRWHWSIEQIQAMGIADLSVVELIANNISQLPLATQEVLKLAACIGSCFKLEVLATSCKKSSTQIASDLWSALQQGLILPWSNDYKIPLLFGNEELKSLYFDDYRLEYRFLHDRVQQAAYSLIPDSQKQAKHLEIGRLLLQNISPTELVDNIFDIVNQLNKSVDLIQKHQEKIHLADLNLMAANRALLAAAFEPAYNYFSQGISLLPVDCWQQQYQLTLGLYTGAAQAACFCTKFVEMKALVDVALTKIDNINDKIKIYELLILYHHTQSQFKEAVSVALQPLALLGENFPESPDTQSFIDAFTHTQKLIAEVGFENLDKLPLVSDSSKADAMRILYRALSPAFFAVPAMWGLIVCRLVDLTIQYGESPLTAYAFAMFSIMLNSGIGDISTGTKFGDLAVLIDQKQKSSEYKSAFSNIYYGLARNFYKPVKSSIKPLIQGYLGFADNGDAEYSAYCIVNAYFCSILAGQPLEKVQTKFDKFIKQIVEFKQEQVINQLYIWTQVIHNLTGKSTHKSLLKGDRFNIEPMLPQLMASNNFNTVNYANIAQSMLFYLFGEYELAHTHAAQTEPYLGASGGKFLIFAHNFYYSLSLTALYDSVSKLEQGQFLEKLALLQAKMKNWADHCPENFLHKYLLVEAEIARITGHELEAMDYYDRAIASAEEHGFIQNQALGNELAAKFWLSKGKEDFAKIYMTKAFYSYIRWEAIAKAQDLDERYPHLIIHSEDVQILKTDITISKTRTSTAKTTSNSNDILDLATIIKASQTISSEIILDKLLDKVLSIIIENASAQKVCLMLAKNNELFIEAIRTQENTTVILQSTPVIASQDIPISLINYVARTQEPLLLDDAISMRIYQSDPYIQKHKSKSVLCTPILHQGKFIGILYLENNLAKSTFTRERVKILNFIISQAAISLENSRLYKQTHDYATQLENSLTELQAAQLQLIQSEKMSALGNLVAGIAHEINNPIGFILGNLQPANEYVHDLLSLIDLYQRYYSQPAEEITKKIKAIDFEYVREDLPKLITSMRKGIDCIYEISVSLRSFSRSDTEKRISYDIHEGLNSTLLILKHRLKASETRPAIEVIKDYGKLPLISCLPGQLNQVFMNILANAIDALEESNIEKTYDKIVANPNCITVTTKIEDNPEFVTIAIKDNGLGMTEEVKEKIFDHLFTTKPVGKGTGLGLAITRQIIIEKHRGQIEVNSIIGQGTEFIIHLPIG
ncbi:AAA family ATPase [Nostoc sp. FACHB-152]|uniref:trifunctional serine/threonine-protein kinase/ATP-binding protein/sensor histidine kinase n=1 Tax=unclassified Nostoc TaxID=2593658 RepID=UPI001683795D|nr:MULTISPECIES: ATP-binding sensor histidine kinase [unclassified Nostoc]MBD2448128.1 AAA family ATPase [Nostoc sp. FACHB-152]MBD2467124.1 AAA family ATPase [Nostoc sp. FACHB-145]